MPLQCQTVVFALNPILTCHTYPSVDDVKGCRSIPIKECLWGTNPDRFKSKLLGNFLLNTSLIKFPMSWNQPVFKCAIQCLS